MDCKICNRIMDRQEKLFKSALEWIYYHTENYGIEEYINALKEIGMTDEEVREDLKEVGMTDEEIEQELEKL